MHSNCAVIMKNRTKPTAQLNVRMSPPEIPSALGKVSALAEITMQDMMHAFIVSAFGRETSETKEIIKRCNDIVKRHAIPLPFERPLTPQVTTSLLELSTDSHNGIVGVESSNLSGSTSLTSGKQSQGVGDQTTIVGGVRKGGHVPIGGGKEQLLCE